MSKPPEIIFNVEDLSLMVQVLSSLADKESINITGPDASAATALLWRCRALMEATGEDFTIRIIR